MTVRIDLAKNEIAGAKLGFGTRVFNDEGQEIKGITNIHVNIEPNDIVRAVFEVHVESVGDMKNIQALLGVNTLEEIAKMHGFALVPLNG